MKPLSILKHSISSPRRRQLETASNNTFSLTLLRTEEIILVAQQKTPSDLAKFFVLCDGAVKTAPRTDLSTVYKHYHVVNLEVLVMEPKSALAFFFFRRIELLGKFMSGETEVKIYKTLHAFVRFAGRLIIILLTTSFQMRNLPFVNLS